MNGWYVADSLSGVYAKTAVYNKEMVNLMWRVYADSEANVAGYARYGLLHAKNARYSGFAKMDFFFEKKEYTEEQIRNIWKIPSEAGVQYPGQELSVWLLHGKRRRFHGD